MSTDDLAVIGAGAAGLTLASCLQARGRRVAAGDGFGPSADPGRGVAQAVRSGLDAAVDG